MARTDLPPLPEVLRSAVAEAMGRAGVLPARANPGLVFERYPRCWEAAGGRWDLGLGRKDFLAGFAAAYEGLERACAPILEARIGALDRAFPRGGRDYRARWRFVTGIGTDHPLENGFTFHRLLGVPYFAGSTVKGLARAAALAAGVDEEDEKRLFGPPVPADSGERRLASSGAVVFLDALPTTWPRLAVDLLNNHRPTWTTFLGGGRPLERADEASAAGLEDPRPVYFLAVEPEVTFRFWIAERPGSKLASGDLDRVWGWLELGLRYLGIGAKTAVGYGRFAPGGARQPEDQRPPPKPTAPETLVWSGATLRWLPGPGRLQATYGSLQAESGNRELLDGLPEELRDRVAPKKVKGKKKKGKPVQCEVTVRRHSPTWLEIVGLRG